MPIDIKTREYRNMTLAVQDAEAAEGGAMIVRGYATTFDDPYILFEDSDLRFIEEVSPEAFAETDMNDVIMQYDHEGRVFARTRNNTLTVHPDDHGLLIEADLSGTELGRQLYEEIRGGYTDKMSFGFTVESDEHTETKDGKTDVIKRRITGVRKLYDVSAVSIPANDATSISVRNLTDGVIEQIRAERREAEALELRRMKLLTKARLIGGK